MVLRTTLFAGTYLLLAVLWLQAGHLFGVGLAAVFVLLGSGCLVAAGIGSDALLRAMQCTFARAGEGVRDPRDTLTHILMLAEHSRRNGLVGLADVEANWVPLQRVCKLVACAADEPRMRLEAASSIELARQRANHTVLPWFFLAAALAGTGALAFVLSVVEAALSGASLVRGHSVAPLLVALLSLVLVVLPVYMRLVIAREREANCIQLAYEGGIQILQNNSVEAVFHRLVDLVPGAPPAVEAETLGELETGRGPWL
ncbi:MAG: hypothetical protein AAF460_02050 [Pseudomonadota bacterium]